MADLCCVYSYAGININASSGDCLILGEDGVTGLDGRPIRAEIDDQGQSDGGLFFPRFYGARIITFKGFCQIRSVTVEMNAPYYTALNALEAGVISALEGQLNSAAIAHLDAHRGLGEDHLLLLRQHGRGDPVRRLDDGEDVRVHAGRV